MLMKLFILKPLARPVFYYTREVAQPPLFVFFVRPLMQGPCKMPLCVKMISMWELHDSLLLLFDVLSCRLPGSNPRHPSFSFHPNFLGLFWSPKQLELFRDVLLSHISSFQFIVLQ